MIDIILSVPKFTQICTASAQVKMYPLADAVHVKFWDTEYIGAQFLV